MKLARKNQKMSCKKSRKRQNEVKQNKILFDEVTKRRTDIILAG